MRISFLHRLSAICLLLILWTQSAHALIGAGLPTGAITAGACQEAMGDVISREQRMWRSVLYGLSSAEEALIGEVRYNKEGSAWLKTDSDAWRSSDTGFESTTWSNFMMDQEGDLPPRRGIFEQRRALSSDLLPSVIVAARAFRCRLDALCDVLVKSEGVSGTDSQPVSVRPDGCIMMQMDSIPACHLVEGHSEQIDRAQVRGYCMELQKRVMLREFDLLRLAIEYDAAYRSLLQFAGNLDFFLEAYRGTILGSMRSAASLIGWLGRIPCFTASCDDYPPASSSSSTAP